MKLGASCHLANLLSLNALHTLLTYNYIQTTIVVNSMIFTPLVTFRTPDPRITVGLVYLVSAT